MERIELVKIVERLQQADYCSDQEGVELMTILKENVIHPAVSNLIFWNDEELTAEKIVDAALNYKPILLPEKFD